MPWPLLRRAGLVPIAALLGVTAGAAAWARSGIVADRLWLVTLIATGGIVVARTARELWRGRWAADVVASLAIVTAVALDQPLAGLIVVVMQTGGEALERYAEGRASDAVRALEAEAPRIAHVIRDDSVVDVAASAVAPGEHLVVRPGDLVPCDGVVIEGWSTLDTARLTGEAMPVTVTAGTIVQSGSVNGDRPFTMRVTATADASQYARIVELVRTAQASKAPFQRIADQSAIWFTPLTLLIAVLAALISHDMQRVLAVLVVATPCPLILAPPVAIIGGMNRAARRQIIVRDGGALERLARVDVAVLDKTGTITIGRPAVESVTTRAPFTREELLTLAASVEQGAAHLLARSLVDAASADGLVLRRPEDVLESPGRGVTATVDGRHVVVGARSFVAEHLHPDERDRILAEPHPDGLTAFVGIDGRLAGMVAYADALREHVREVLSTLRALGVEHAVLLSGDHTANARAMAARVGIEDARGDLLPADKVAVVRSLVQQGHTVLMIGDGTNDAPALAAASVGVALAGHGGGVSAEAAGVVILTDDFGRVADALAISRRTMRIARQSVWAGIIASGIAMIVAALGHIAPVGGALLQEAIDVAVILNALRASTAGPIPRPERATRAPIEPLDRVNDRAALGGMGSQGTPGHDWA